MVRCVSTSSNICEHSYVAFNINKKDGGWGFVIRDDQGTEIKFLIRAEFSSCNISVCKRERLRVW